ncbi:histone-lysine N-methyltransferase [Acrasis kona]|uniref:Histone-lysine N-methyltransferase n=1 Tax=Acrasis kona TaxID=1008807 RepID=A0AAW2YX02_9EUKA
MMRQQPLCCGNYKCQTTQTPLWRKGWVSSEGKTIMLCNACGLHYKKGHFCMFCNQIYRESDADDHSNPWIGCDRCSHWVHKKCEERNGIDCSSQTPYSCPECRSLPNAPGQSKRPATISGNPAKSASQPNHTNKSKKSAPASPVVAPVIPMPFTTPVTSLPPPPNNILLQQLTAFNSASPTTPVKNFFMFNNSAPLGVNPLQPLNALSSVGEEPPLKFPSPTSVFDPQLNTMPCWSQLKSTISNLTLPPAITPEKTVPKKRKASLGEEGKSKKKKTTTTTITTTTTHSVHGSVVDSHMSSTQSIESDKVDLKITTTQTTRKGKVTPRKQIPNAHHAVIQKQEVTPNFPCNNTLTTNKTPSPVVATSLSDASKHNSSLGEEQFYKYEKMILQQQTKTSVEDSSCDSAEPPTPVTLLHNTLKVDNFYEPFQEKDNSFRKSHEPTSEQLIPNVQIQTTTVTFTTSSAATSVKLKKKKKKSSVSGSRRDKKYVNSSETEDSDGYERSPEIGELNISIDEVHHMLSAKFPKAPVLMKMGSLWAVCEVIRQELGSV